MDLVAGGRLGLRDRIRQLDPILMACVVSLTAIGLLSIYSATHQSLRTLDLDPGFYLRRQAAFIAVGLVVVVVLASLDFRFLRIYAPVVYGISVLLLLLVATPLGTEVAGSQRWFQLLGYQFQPSEFAKVALMLMLAAFLSDLRGREPTLGEIGRACGLTALPAALVFLQPDLGTAIVLAAILVGVLVVAAARPRHLGILFVSALVFFVGALQIGLIREYQVSRLTSFLDPESDPLRSGYNREQAEIAIGAGGLFGRGYLQGSQTNLDFVPEQHTDFVFTVVGEEFGFVGAAVLLGVLLTLIWRAFRIARGAPDLFGSYVAAAIGTYLGLQAFVNVGMTVGIMPITGIPLPFVSYGGTALLVNSCLVGILISINRRGVA